MQPSFDVQKRHITPFLASTYVPSQGLSIRTEHHANKGIRIVPIFPELKPLFQDAFDNAMEGDIYCITRYREGSNLSPQMIRIVKRAGLEPWAKIFQNLRSTRETELFKMTKGNVKAVCSWIGNSPAIAMSHYAQVTDEDFKEAAKMSLIKDVEKRVQKRVHTRAEQACTGLNEGKIDNDVSVCNYKTNKENAPLCKEVQKGLKWAILDLNQ